MDWILPSGLTHNGTVYVVTIVSLAFALAFLIGVLPMNLFVRASLVSVGVMGIFAIPYAARPEIDIEAAYWVWVAFVSFGAWVVGVVAGVLARAGLRRLTRGQSARSSGQTNGPVCGSDS